MPRPTYPMSNRNRSRLGGLAKVARHGTEHMAAQGRRGAEALDLRIAREAGIPDDLRQGDPDEWARRLKAARTAYYLRLSNARWSRAGSRAKGA